jgi:hypothetical protein
MVVVLLYKLLYRLKMYCQKCDHAIVVIDHVVQAVRHCLIKKTLSLNFIFYGRKLKKTS